ncbi:MAG: hypothetical protein EXS64_12910 [Candidatus Latescibacteria bacterium]|nr:hypothetical protein [Candidatus Latescibacterota bacterium]
MTAPDARISVEEFVLPSREAFLRDLDLTRPELTDVKAALERGDVEAAGRACIAHFRARPFTSPLLTDWPARTPDPKFDTARADGLLAGHMWDGYSIYEAPPTGLDWYGSPLSCLTRFPVLGTLREAIFHTGDPKYLRWTVDHILDYMDAYPIQDFAGHTVREGWVNHTTVAKPWYWCMVPERLTELSETIHLIRRYPQASDEALLRILERMVQEVAYLRFEIKSQVDARHNGGCAMIYSMAQALAILDDFARTPAWRAYNAGLAAQYFNEAFYPDGMCIELTTAYSASVSLFQQGMAYALRDEEAIRAIRGKVKEMVVCMVALSDPTWWLPSFGDLYAHQVGEYIEPPLTRWLDLPWAETVRRQTYDGPLPPFTEWPVRGQEQWCGYYTMRSDWEPKARYMAIDGGPWGTSHQHGDRLSFVLTACGAKFIIDPSSTRYASNEPDTFVGRQPSGFLHNAITIDGVDEFMSHNRVPNGDREAKAPLQNRWETGDAHTLFVGSYSFAPLKPVRWERRMLFVDRAYWLLQDILTGGQPTAQIEQNFQFEADIEIAFQDRMTIATAPGGARLVLLPLSGGLVPHLTVGDKTPHTTYWPNGTPTTILSTEDNHDQIHGRGWTGRGGNRLLPAPAVTYVGSVHLPASLTVALIPLDPGQTLDALPEITSQVAGDKITWALPIRGGRLRFVTDVERCLVEP